jgi:hypothetical protein
VGEAVQPGVAAHDVERPVRKPSRGQPPLGRRSRSSTSAPVPVQRTFGERPQAPWHPLPLSEIMILAGAIAAAAGFARRSASVPPLLLTGIAVTALGAIEVSWREHRFGYRSHTLLLAFLPVVVFHTAAVLVTSAFARFPAALNIPLIAVDVGLFLALFRVLRARFLDARARAAARR